MCTKRPAVLHGRRAGDFLGIRKRPAGRRALFRAFSLRSDGAGHLSAAEAAGAGVDVLGASVYYGLDALDVGLPGAVGAPVRVADLDAEGHVLAAEFTLRHV